MDQLFGDMLDARLDELDAAREPAVPQSRARTAALFPTPRTKDEALLQALVVQRRRRARARRAGHRAAARRALRVHRDRAGAREAGDDAQLRAQRHREPRPRVGEPRRRVHAQLPAGRSAADDLAGAGVPSPLRARHHAGRDQRARRATGFPIRTGWSSSPAPEAAGVALPDQAQLAAAVKTASAKRLEPYVDVDAGQALMDAPPARGTIVKTTPRPEAGITEWTLSNGATVVLKPTTLKEDQILFRASAPGGTSLASDADFIAGARRRRRRRRPAASARSATSTLDKLLTGKAVAVRAVHRRDHQGMGGGSTPQDLETMFQLLYLRFTQPRADPAAFAALVGAGARACSPTARRAPTSCSTRRSTPRSAGNIARRQPETPATVDQWDLAKSLAFYKARFADASRFTFVFVGSFTPEMHQAVRRNLRRQPAGDARAAKRGATSASRRRPASSRRRSRRASRRRARWRSSSPGRSCTTTRTCWRCGR